MAAAIISATEDFVRSHFATAIEEAKPIGPVTKAILDTLLTECASHVGQIELRGSGASTGDQFALRLALGFLNERYGTSIVQLAAGLS